MRVMVQEGRPRYSEGCTPLWKRTCEHLSIGIKQNKHTVIQSRQMHWRGLSEVAVFFSDVIKF